ncbi:MAG: hypothetical protein QXK93_00500 [Candidatus Bathyarchaeia archaeon]
MRAITRHLKKIKSNRDGVSNVLVVMLSLILITVIVANVVIWSQQMNQLDIERMHESVSITNAGHLTHSEWFTAQNEFSWSGGNRTGGSYVDTKTMDDQHESFIEGLQTIYSFTANDETFVDQQSNVDSLNDIGTHSNFNAMKAGPDAVYDTLTEQIVTIEDPASKTNAIIAYRSNTGTYTLSSPKNRIWTGNSALWGSEVEMPTAGSPVRWVRSEYCPVKSRGYEVIVMTISDDRHYDLYIWNGSQWLVFNNIGYFAGTTFYRGFDIAYEHASGRALIVYSRGTATDGQEIGYRIWDGTTLSQEYLLGSPYTTGIVYWINLASCPGTRAGTADDNEIAMIFIDSNADVFGYIWNGSGWSTMGQTAVWDATAAIATEECIAVAYEQLSGRAMFIWGDATATDNYYRIWDGTTLTAATLLDIAAQGGLTNWVTLKSQPNSNGLLFTAVDAGSDLNTAYWSGSAWTVHTEHDAAVDTHAARCADFAWSPTGSNGILVWGTTAGSISYRVFTPPNTWTTTSTATAAGTHPWVQLRTNPRYVSGDKYVIGAVLNSNFDIGSITWDGTTFTITEGVITADTTVSTYECFEIAFMNFGPLTVTYQLDLEVQWVNANYTRPNEYLCIYAGTLNSESLQVDVWTGSSWVTIINALTTGWNNVSVSDYLTSSTFTIRFRDTETLEDKTQSSWQIDCALLRTWETSLRRSYRLELFNSFTIDLSIYPLDRIYGVEIMVRYKVSETNERWLIKAYDWSSGNFSDEGFNITEGSKPTSHEWNNYAVSITENWTRYIQSNGTVQIMFCDADLSENQIFVDIDFIGVRVILNGIFLELKNSGATTAHVVAIWVMNTTHHMRFDLDFFINPGESATLRIVTITPPTGDLTVKIVTERGNIDAF